MAGQNVHVVVVRRNETEATWIKKIHDGRIVIVAVLVTMGLNGWVGYISRPFSRLQPNIRRTGAGPMSYEKAQRWLTSGGIFKWK